MDQVAIDVSIDCLKLVLDILNSFETYYKSLFESNSRKNFVSEQTF